MGEVVVKCGFCNKDVTKQYTEVKRNKTYFCNRECYAKNRQKPNSTCHVCGKSFRKSKSNKEKYNYDICGSVCLKEHWKIESDLSGKCFGRCSVIKREPIGKSTDRWLLECKCGERFNRSGNDIRSSRVYECPNCIFRRSQYYIGGKKFGRLSVLDNWEWRTSPTNGKRFRYWQCKCECGKDLWIQSGSILKGHTVSCGCYMQKNSSRYVNETLYPIRHGKSGKKQDFIYSKWTILVHKCHNPKYSTYSNWGGLGYCVCEDWKNNYESFRQWCLELKIDPSMTVGIKDGEKEFNSDNCYVMDIKKYHNKLRHKRNLELYGILHKGEVKLLTEWADHYSMDYGLFRSRYAKLKDIQKVVEMEYNGNTGIRMKRTEISDEKIKELYDEGYTIAEIERILNFSGVWYRLQKMGYKVRSQKKRSSCIIENEIKKMIDDGCSYQSIVNEGFYSSKYNLHRKLKEMGIDKDRLKK